jgi:hypothetical protein
METNFGIPVKSGPESRHRDEKRRATRAALADKQVSPADAVPAVVTISTNS